MSHFPIGRSCLSGFTIFVKLVGSNAFFNAYFWTRVVGFILVPSLLLICLNALLIRSIRKAQQRKLRLLKWAKIVEIIFRILNLAKGEAEPGGPTADGQQLHLRDAGWQMQFIDH
jgi:hypothetical protein